MPAPGLSAIEATRRIEAIEQALRDGHPPPGVIVKSGMTGAIARGYEICGVNGNRGSQEIERLERLAGRKIRWDLYKGVGAKPKKEEPKAAFTPPVLPSEDIPIDDLIGRLCENFERKNARAEAKKWMKFTLHDDGPFILAFFGDPHLDDNGCNWPLLRRDVHLAKTTPHVHAVGMGDYTNNWAGKLQHIYAHQEVTRDAAWRLASWFFAEVPWMLLIKGNHDLWSNKMGQGDPLDWMKRGSAPLEDWQAQFQVVTPSGRAFRVWAAHDFKGNSIYNPLHGLMRAQRFSSGDADILVAGDEHHWEMFQGEDAEKNNHIYWALRARGYKFIDPHAERLQFAPQQHGATIAALVDPSKAGPAAIQCYADFEEACAMLQYKRKLWSAANGKKTGSR